MRKNYKEDVVSESYVKEMTERGKERGTMIGRKRKARGRKWKR